MTNEHKNELTGLCKIEIRRCKAASEANPNMRYMVELMEVALAALTEQPHHNGMMMLSHKLAAAETKLAELAKQPAIGRVDRGELSDNNEYPNARVVCLHDQADWENFQDGTELFLRPAPAVGMDNPEPYAWLVHAPQGDYVERNPEVVANLEGTGLTKCKPLYLDL